MLLLTSGRSRAAHRGKGGRSSRSHEAVEYNEGAGFNPMYSFTSWVRWAYYCSFGPPYCVSGWIKPRGACQPILITLGRSKAIRREDSLPSWDAQISRNSEVVEYNTGAYLTPTCSSASRVVGWAYYLLHPWPKQLTEVGPRLEVHVSLASGATGRSRAAWGWGGW